MSRDKLKLSNAIATASAYQKLTEPKNYEMGDRDIRTGNYNVVPSIGGVVPARKITNAQTTSATQVLVRGGDQNIVTADAKVGAKEDPVLASNSFGSVLDKGDLNKDLWGTDPRGVPVDVVPAFYWFGFIEDSLGRLEITIADYQHYSAMVAGTAFPKSNESVEKVVGNKILKVAAAPSGSLLVQMSQLGGGVGEVIFEGRTEVWGKTPGRLVAHRKILDSNKTGLGAGIVQVSLDPPNSRAITATRGNPADRSGQGVVQSRFYRLAFDVGLPGRLTQNGATPNYTSYTITPSAIPIAADIIYIVEF